ncbi:MAG: pilus assembly protein N-terminal domain-containing protein [Prolixibacteraceae bacterium]
MRKLLFFFAVTLTLFACDKDDDGLNLQLSIESCVLDNEHSYAEVKKLNGTGSLSVTSSDPDIAEIRFDEKDKNVFYIIGHGQGSATITVMDADDSKTGSYDIKTIDVNVRESIGYEYYSARV